MLVTAGAKPIERVLWLERRLRCRGCDARGKAVVSIKWASPVNAIFTQSGWIPAMNALIFVIVLLFGNANIGLSGVAVVWAFLVVVEWLADRFAGWLSARNSSAGSSARSIAV